MAATLARQRVVSWLRDRMIRQQFEVEHTRGAPSIPAAVGDIVHARNRPYGLEFARFNDEKTREAFFLVLADDWHKELDSRRVSL